MHQPYTRIAPDTETAVLFIHGIAGSPDHFLPFLPQVPAHISAYSILLPGHGGSVSDFSRSSMKKWKDYTDAAISQLLQRHQKLILVAHSMGTLFAIRAALHYPGRIQRLFLLAVPLTVRLTPASVSFSLKTMFGCTGNDVRARAAEAASSIRHTRKLWEYIPWLARFGELLLECRRTRPLPPMLHTPCSAFQSRRDELVGPGAAKRLQKAGIPVVMLEKSGHFYYAPEDMRLLLEAFSQIFA